MKILIATPLYPPDIGGPATYSKLLEEQLSKRGFDVKLMSFSQVRYLPKGLAHLVYFFQILKVAPRQDLIYVLDPSPSMLPAAVASLLCGKKYILKIVGDIAWEQGKQRSQLKENLDDFVLMGADSLPVLVRILRKVQSFIAERAQKIIVPSEYLKNIVMKWGVPSEKISVIYNAFDEPSGLPDKPSVHSELGMSGTVLLSAGRLVPWKGFATLIALVPELKKKIPDIKLYIAGEGPDEAKLKQEIIDRGLEDIVTLLGRVEHKKLMHYIRAADCFVLNTGYEGLSHQLLEVLAVGTPIVTTNIGGNPEIIEHEKTGLLVDYDDGPALVREIGRVVVDEKLSGGVTKQGKAFVSTFTVARMMEETVKVLSAIIKPTL